MARSTYSLLREDSVRSGLGGLHEVVVLVKLSLLGGALALDAELVADAVTLADDSLDDVALLSLRDYEGIKLEAGVTVFGGLDCYDVV